MRERRQGRYFNRARPGRQGFYPGHFERKKMLNLRLYKGKEITLSERDTGKVLGSVSLDPDCKYKYVKIGFKDFSQDIRIVRSDMKKGAKDV